MRILHVNDYRSLGGCEVLMDTTVALLRSRDLEVEVFTSQDVPGLRRTPLSYVDSWAGRRGLARRLVAFRPQVIHLHNYYHILSPGILGTIAGYRRAHEVRVLMTAHDYHLICPNSGLLFVRHGSPQCADPSRVRHLSYLLSRRWDVRGTAFSLLKLIQHLWNYRLLDRRRVIDCILCPSRYLQRVLGDLGLPTMLLPHPVPKVERPSAKPAGELRLVFAGRIEPEKGLVQFLEHFPARFPARLTIVGEGGLLRRCRDVCRRRHLDQQVDFTGRLTRAEAMSIIEQSHVLILPSLCLESYPMSLLEALAMGTNILVSDLGGMREVVETAGVGFRVQPNDRDSLGSALDAIAAAFRDGTLNSFDVTGFLGERDETVYTERLLSAYGPNGQCDPGSRA